MSRGLTVTRSFVPLRWVGCVLLVASPTVAARRLAVPAGKLADAIR